MTERPLILIAPCLQQDGVEFSDESISLSNAYTNSIIAAGGLPVALPASADRAVIAELVRRTDGVLMTGGEDISPRLYAPDMPAELAAKVGPAEALRDEWEPPLVKEIFAQGRPVFGICRGHQMLNVALGGTLLADIPTQVKGTINHSRMDIKREPAHTVTVETDSLLAEITGRTTLEVNSTHHQALDRMAPGLRAVARSADGVIEAAELRERGRLPFFLTVQFHPERLVDRDGVFGRLFERFVGACARARRNV